MNEVENVTGSMGGNEAVAPAGEAKDGVADDDAGPVEHGDADTDFDTSGTAVARTDTAAAPPRDAGSNPWQALAQVGAQFVAALAAANDPDAAAHPWIERDPATGAQSLKMPLPPPETARQLANALSVLADSLRARIA
jgi:hypothetical protein